MNKVEKYKLLLEQIKSLTEGETDEVAVMANIAAAIHTEMGFWWTGFYRVKNGELILGPFQGPVACMHIPFGRGVCGTAWHEFGALLPERRLLQIFKPYAIRKHSVLKWSFTRP